MVGRKAVVVEMRSDGIVKAENVFKESQVEFVKRCVMVAIDNLFFEVFEKAFHNGIVVRVPLCRKGLNHVKHIQMLSEFSRGKLRAAISVKNDPLRFSSLRNSHINGINGKLHVNIT